MLKYIVTDLDGTLLSHDKTITDDNVKAIKEAMTHGTRLMTASGRSFASIKPELDDYSLSFECISGNGAEYCDENGKILLTEYFPKERLKAVTDVLLERNLPFMIFASKERFYCLQDPKWVEQCFVERGKHIFHKDITKEERYSLKPCANLVQVELDDLMADDIDIIKVESFVLIEEKERMFEAKDALAPIKDIAYLSSFIDNVEVTSIKAQKGLILEEVLEMKGISKEEVLICGDGMNDVTMFERFPYTYAPSNALEEIKEKAHLVVSSHNERNIADAIEDYNRVMNGD